MNYLRELARSGAAAAWFDFEGAMLSGLSKGLRLRAAVMLAALYAVCVLAPSAALAITPQAAHCLTESQGAAHVHRYAAQAAPHTHTDDTEHPHADAATAQDPATSGDEHRSSNCCGLFCVSALASEPAAALLAPPSPALAGPALTSQLDGCEPDRIHRPPIG